MPDRRDEFAPGAVAIRGTLNDRSTMAVRDKLVRGWKHAEVLQRPNRSAGLVLRHHL